MSWEIYILKTLRYICISENFLYVWLCVVVWIVLDICLCLWVLVIVIQWTRITNFITSSNWLDVIGIRNHNQKSTRFKPPRLDMTEIHADSFEIENFTQCGKLASMSQRQSRVTTSSYCLLWQRTYSVYTVAMYCSYFPLQGNYWYPLFF